MFQLGKHSLKRTLARVLLVSICVSQSLFALSPVRSVVAASAPNIVNYQGRVLNTNGIPVSDDTVSMIFELYTAVSGGSCVWSNSSATCASATSRTVTLTDGLFSESLGDTGSSYAAIGDSIFGDNATLFLQVTIAGEVLTPRKQLVAAPYALNSDTLDGLDADTDGATVSAIVALSSAGNVVFTGDPTGSTVSTGVAYINPAAAGADETIFGIGDNGTDRFRVDKEGDVFIKTIELDGVGTNNVTSGASLIGVFDELSLSSSLNVQDVLDDLDQAIDDIVTGGAVSKWTDSGTFTYLTATADDIVIGDSTVAGASLFFDESVGQLDLGTDDALGGTIRLYSVTAATADPTLAADASGNLDITTAAVELSGDLLITGGDLTSTSGTFNFLDAAGNSTTLDIGGVTTDLGNTINVATNSTTADVLTIGNSNAATTLALTGGDNWNIAATGVATFSASAAATTAIVVTDTDYTNALSIGDNNITGTTYSLVGTTSTIDFTNFDVASTGAITVAAGVGLDTNGAGALALGNTNATSVSICNSATCDTITVGSNADADTITIGDAASDTTTLNGTTVAVDSGTWDITTAGVASGFTGLTTTGNITVSSAQVLGGTPMVFEGATDDNVTTAFAFTDPTVSNKTVTFQNASGTVAYMSDLFSTNLTDNITNSLDIQEGTNDYFNISTVNGSEVLTFGNATTNPSFSYLGSGTITTAGDIALNGGDLTSSSATFNLLATASTTVNAFDAATTLNINDAAVTSTIDIGGVTSSGTNTINVATEGTAADVITIGNSNAATTLALTGGDDWSIAATGVQTMSASAAATTAIVITDTDYTNSLSIGDNDITGTTYDLIGTTAVINFTNFDVASTGAITVAAGVGLDTNGTGALALGNTNATSVSICNSAVCDTITIGSNADADTITIGDSTDTGVSITDNNWSISTAGLITTDNDVAVNGGDLTSTSATFNLLDAASNSTTLEIGGVTTDLGNTITIATNSTTADTITAGNSNAATTMALTGGDDWSIAATGVATFSASAAATTAIVITDTDYTNALSVGDNVILGTTAAIDFTNFDVATTGGITVAAGVGLDTNGAGALAIGNTNATSVSECNSAACDTWTVGTNADADTITIGEVNDDVSITDANWSITAAGAASFSTINLTDDVDFTFVTDGAQSENFGIGITHASDVSLTGMVLTMTDSAGADIGDNYLAAFINADDGGATGTIDGMFVLQHGDTNEAVADGLFFDVAAGGLTTAINAVDAQIVTALSVGANDIVGTTGTINYTNFDVSAAGEVLVAATQGIDTNAAGALRLGQTNATSVAICNSSTCDTISIGLTSDADSILIGEVNDNMAITEADWSITAAGLITTADDIAINGGDLTSTAATFNLLATASTTVNAFDSATTLNINDAAVTSTLDIGGVTNSGTNTINVATEGTAADVITIGNSNAATTMALTGGDDWSIAATGVQTMSASAAATTAIVITDTDYTNSLSIGDNDITGTTFDLIGTTSTIDFTNFDVASTGAITVAAGVGLDTNGAGALALGNTNATSVSMCNSAACDTISIGTNADADTITIGDSTDSLALTEADWSITTAGLITTAGDLAVNGDDITSDGTLTINPTSSVTIGSDDDLFTSGDVTFSLTGAEVFTVSDSGSGGIDFNLLSTGDFGIDVGGTSVFTIDDAGKLNFDAVDATGAPGLAGGNQWLTLNGGTFTDSSTAASGTSTSHLYNVVGASNLAATNANVTTSDAATFYLGGAPVATTNMTITRAWALWSEADIRIDTDAVIGANTSPIETLSDAGFALDGDDLFVADDVGVEGVIYADGGLAVGSSGDITCTDCLTFTDLADTMTLDTSTTFGTGINGLILSSTTQTNGTMFSLDQNSPDMFGTGGDGINIDNSATYTSALTVSGSSIDINRTLTNNSGGVLTVSGDVLSIVSANANTSGTLTDTSDLISLTQSNTTASGRGIIITNAGTGSSILVDPSGDTGTTVSSTVGGAVHIENSGNANYGLTVYSNLGGSAASPLSYMFNDNVAYDVNVAEIRNDSTNATASSGLVITQNVVADATTAATSQALIINVNESSNSDEVILILSDADGTPDAEFRFENDGDLFGDGAAYNSGADYAEFFYTVDSSLTDHQVVCQDTLNNLAVKKCGLSDPTVVGVVSTNPGFVGNNIPGADGSLEDNPNYRIVGLEGQIETYVTAADGAIAVGDALTASDITAGYAGKATDAGRIIGFALEPLASGSGLIKVRVTPGWHGGDVITESGEVNSFTATLALESLSTATALSPAANSNALAFRGSAWNGSAAEAVAMTLSTKVTNASNYRLSVANNSGAEVAYINNLGDLVLSGKLYPSNQGVAQTSAYIYYDSNGVGYMRTNAAGWGTGSYDFAEMFPAPEVLYPGEVVVFGDAAEQVKRSTGETYDDRIAGVVSTRPGFLAGTYRPGDSPIALSGRVPTKVNTENGAVSIGDPLTTSSTPGVAMKATEPGPIVGYAMQPLTESTGTIIVFIRASYYAGGDSGAPAIVAAPVSGVGDASNLTSLSLNGGPITSVASISGLGNTWSLTESGNLVTRGRLVQVVKSHQNEDVETYIAASRQMTIQLSGTATLNGNTAVVKFEDIDPQFNDIIGTTSSYRVLATPSGLTGQIYVTDRTNEGFTVHAESADNGVLVDWLVIAYHKDYEPETITVPEVGAPTPDAPPVVEEVPPVPEPEVAGETTETPVEEPVIEPVVEPIPEAPVVVEPAVIEPVPEVTP